FIETAIASGDVAAVSRLTVPLTGERLFVEVIPDSAEDCARQIGGVKRAAARVSACLRLQNGGDVVECADDIARGHYGALATIIVAEEVIGDSLPELFSENQLLLDRVNAIRTLLAGIASGELDP